MSYVFFFVLRICLDYFFFLNAGDAMDDLPIGRVGKCLGVALERSNDYNYCMYLKKLYATVKMSLPTSFDRSF